MERKEITAFLIDCKPDEFTAYADQGDKGTVVVGPVGKKYRFSVEQLEKGQKVMSEKIMQLTLAEAATKMAEQEKDLEAALDEGDKIREEKEVEKAAAEEPASPAPKRKKPAAKKKAAPRKKPKPAPKTA